MDEIQRQFLDIVRQVRSHLELQRALGVKSVEISSGLPFRVDGLPPVAAPAAIKEPPAGRRSVARDEQGLAAVHAEFADCSRCKLSGARKKIVFGEGNPDATLMFIGEAPGQDEDDLGKPFAGAAGQLLTDIIVKGMQLGREDVYISTIVKCATPGHRKPAPDEIKACGHLLIRQIEAIKPKIIVALGGTAASVLLKTRETITAIRGKWHDYNGIPVMPTFHPTHLLKKESDKRFVWGDIKKIMAEMEKMTRG